MTNDTKAQGVPSAEEFRKEVFGILKYLQEGWGIAEIKLRGYILDLERQIEALQSRPQQAVTYYCKRAKVQWTPQNPDHPCPDCEPVIAPLLAPSPDAQAVAVTDDIFDTARDAFHDMHDGDNFDASLRHAIEAALAAQGAK